jgi:hypothetical protein
MSHAHVHVPHELSEREDGGAGGRPERAERMLELGAVLFFAGISLRLQWRPLRVAVLALGGAMLLAGAVFVLTLPVG